MIKHRRLCVENLEQRRVLAVFTPNTTVDATDKTLPGDGVVDVDSASAGNQISLRGAIQEANALLGEDTVQLGPGNFRLTIGGRSENAAATGDLDVTSDLRIIGAGAQATVIDASGLDRVFHVMPGIRLTVAGVTITGGLATGIGDTGRDQFGGGILNHGHLTLIDSIVTNNSAPNSNFTTSGGGGIWSSEANSTLNISGVTFSGNNGGLLGGAIQSKGALAVAGSVFTGNSAGRGGAIYTSNGLVSVRDSSFTGNSAGASGGSGGALENADGTVFVERSHFTGNTAHNAGAVRNTRLTSFGTSSMEIADSTFTNNSATGFAFNSQDGGAIINFATMTITRSTLTGNTAQRDGGAIINGGGSLVITGSTLSGNSAVNAGGAIRNDGSLTINGSTINGNNAVDGGGIFNLSNSSLTVTNSTISGNSAIRGGGLNHIGAASTATLLNATIANNTAGTGGGISLGVFAGTTTTFGPLNMKNTLVAGNTATTSGPDVFGQVTSGGFNLIGNSSAASGFAGSDQQNVNPLLGPLQDNGGPTQTHALAAGSPAIDRGTNTGAPALDQRGLPRPIDGDGNGSVVTDVGAVEFLNNTVPVAAGDRFVIAGNSGASTAVNSILANDTDADGQTLSAVLVSNTTRGTVQLQSNGIFTYTPGANFKGIDRFTYLPNDGFQNGNVATVTILSHNAMNVEKLYLQVLGRPPEDAATEFQVNRMNQGVTLGGVASGIFESPERLDPIIAQMYRDFLLREAEPAGIAFYRDVWQRDGGPHNVRANIISSPEFFQSAGGTNAAWVGELYKRLLGRTAAQFEIDFHVNRLQQGASRQVVVLGFALSPENFRNLIRSWYVQYLNRQPSSQELGSLVAQMEAGASERDIQIGLIDGLEYRNSPPPPAPGSSLPI